MGGVRVRLLPADEDYSLRGETLAQAIEEDRAKVCVVYFHPDLVAFDQQR